jgi:hypothetical protein
MGPIEDFVVRNETDPLGSAARTGVYTPEETMTVIAFPRTEDVRLGRGIQRVRQARGLSLARLAAETRLDPLRLDLAEHGRTRLSSAELHAVINALHAPLALLFQPSTDLSALRKF